MVTRCTEELTAHAQQRVELAFELRLALEQQQLQVHYQPVHDLRPWPGRRRGVGALGASAAWSGFAGGIHSRR